MKIQYLSSYNGRWTTVTAVLVKGDVTFEGKATGRLPAMMPFVQNSPSEEKLFQAAWHDLIANLRKARDLGKVATLLLKARKRRKPPTMASLAWKNNEPRDLVWTEKTP